MIASIEAMLLKVQLRWAGHVSRMEDHRLPKITLYGELSTGHCDRGAPKKRYEDSLRKSLGVCRIDCGQWSALAAWRYTVHQAVSSFEASHKKDLRETPQEEDQSRARPLTTATPAGPACPVLDLLVVGVDSHLYLIFVSEVKPRD